jgi:hypothetical protein
VARKYECQSDIKDNIIIRCITLQNWICRLRAKGTLSNNIYYVLLTEHLDIIM